MRKPALVANGLGVLIQLDALYRRITLTERGQGLVKPPDS